MCSLSANLGTDEVYCSTNNLLLRWPASFVRVVVSNA